MCQSIGPTVYARKFMKSQSVLSAFLLFLDNKMMQQIKKCTEMEARHVLETNNWTVTLDKLMPLLEFYMLKVYVVQIQFIFILCGQIHGV